MITIDEEFKNLIPPLSDEEFSQLEENCVREGIRDPLVVWKVSDDTDILIDGHNRWQISASHGGLPFDLKRMTFESRDDAKAWIIRNQIGRRNLNTYNRSLLALELKELIAAKAKERMMSGKADPSQNSGQGKTDKQLATLAGVSHDTIHKVEAIEKSGNDLLKTQARNGDISIHKAYQIATGRAKKKALVEPLMTDEFWRVHNHVMESGNIEMLLLWYDYLLYLHQGAVEILHDLEAIIGTANS